jgi:hypothetical protein
MRRSIALQYVPVKEILCLHQLSRLFSVSKTEMQKGFRLDGSSIALLYRLEQSGATLIMSKSARPFWFFRAETQQ